MSLDRTLDGLESFWGVIMVVRVWRNAGLSWWNRSWEASVNHVHVYAWTYQGAIRKTVKLLKRVEWR